MATSEDFVKYVCEQVSEAGPVRYRKMFGEYVVYCRAKPIFLVCDNMVFVKSLPVVKSLFERNGVELEVGYPFNGAKEHLILDVDERCLAIDIASLLSKELPYPESSRIK
jgi:hypothetical protein